MRVHWGVLCDTFNPATIGTIMKIRVTLDDFVQAFMDRGRESHFSRPALYGLFNYIEDYEESAGEEIELDVIALCCDYTEMEYSDISHEYRIDVSDCEDVEEARERVLDHLGNHSQVVWYDNDTVLFSNF
jgi:hypothetical protein